MKRVTVIVPAYNAAAYLGAALDSLLAQSYSDWAAIVVDGGSTDTTRQLATRFGPRVRLIDQEGDGLSAARNTAIRASCSELIALLDADDVWLPQRLERCVAALDNNPKAGLVHSRVLRINHKGELLQPPPTPPLRYLSGQIANYLYTRRAHVLCPTVLFRRKYLVQTGMFDESMRGTEDRDLWYRIASISEVAYIDEVLAYYRITPNSLSSNWERVRCAQLKFLGKYRCQAGDRAFRQGLANMHRERGDVLFNQGALSDALHWYGKAIRHDPFSFRNLYMFMRALGQPVVRLWQAPA